MALTLEVSKHVQQRKDFHPYTFSAMRQCLDSITSSERLCLPDQPRHTEVPTSSYEMGCKKTEGSLCSHTG